MTRPTSFLRLWCFRTSICRVACALVAFGTILPVRLAEALPADARARPLSLAAADFDGDGIRDLSCPHASADSGFMTIGRREPRAKILFDTDIGSDIDDAWALAFILSHDEFEPLGITITNGNTPARARIACKMLHQTGRDAIPVALGRRTSDGDEYQFSWAEDFTATTPIAEPAADFIVETVKRYPGEVTIIAVGPLENLADALRKEPNLSKYVKRVVLMSGCVYGMAGGKAPVPEWNVVSSTKDAQLVYAAGLPLTIVPLDSTTQVQLRDDERDRIRKYDSVLTRTLEALYRLWLVDRDSRMTLHDQLAVAEAASPGTFFARRPTLNLRVDDEGFTRIDDRAGGRVEVCLEPKRDELVNYYIGQLLAQHLGGR